MYGKILWNSLGTLKFGIMYAKGRANYRVSTSMTGYFMKLLRCEIKRGNGSWRWVIFLVEGRYKRRMTENIVKGRYTLKPFIFIRKSRLKIWNFLCDISNVRDTLANCFQIFWREAQTVPHSIDCSWNLRTIKIKVFNHFQFANY